MKLAAHERGLARRRMRPDTQRRITAEDALWRIRLVREAVQLRGQQKILADELGVSKVQVCRWLNGVRPVPDRYLLPLAWIMEGAA